MEVDEASKSSGRFNLDRVAQEQMNEDMNTWTSPETVPFMRDLESGRIRPLRVDVALPCLTLSLTGSSQASAGTYRLNKLQERLQSRTPESQAREAEPLNWREHTVRSVMISNYKKNTDGAYHRHRREDWTAVQCERRDAFNDVTWAEYFTQPRIPEGTVHLMIGDSLVRVLTMI